MASYSVDCIATRRISALSSATLLGSVVPFCRATSALLSCDCRVSVLSWF